MEIADIRPDRDTMHILLTFKVGDFVLALYSLTDADFSYGVDVYRPATESEAFIYGGSEGAPVFADQWGGHSFTEAVTVFDDLLGWYAALSGDDTPGRVDPVRLPLKPGTPIGDGATAVSVEEYGHDAAFKLTDSMGRTRTVSRWCRPTLYPSGSVFLDNVRI